MEDNFTDFIHDSTNNVMYITGSAGTGKTTLLAKFIEYLLAEHIPTVVCAFTHRASKVIASKVNKAADIRTLHKFLRKRPGINENALKAQYIQVSSQFGDPEPVRLVIIDEYSMVSKEDFDLLVDLGCKLLFLGDNKQLPPVGAEQGVIPKGKYNFTLTKVYRQDGNKGLLDPIYDVVKMIEGGPMKYVEPTDTFKRNVDIASAFCMSKSNSRLLLAWTNSRVEQLNALIQENYNTTMRYSPTTREYYSDSSPVIVTRGITPVFGDFLKYNTKYKSLEHLLYIAKDYGIEFMELLNDEEEEATTRAVVFGHGKYNELMNTLRDNAAKINAKIMNITDDKPAYWAKAHRGHVFAKQRAKIWRDLLTIQENVICLDYPFATSVHKSQGLTVEEVFIDSADIQRNKNKVEMLKLLYVAMSRASDRIYMNT